MNPNPFKHYILRYRIDLAALAVVMVGALGGCRPTSLMLMEPPNGSPEYTLGWQDGCDSGLSAVGGWDYKLMYGFKKRPEYMSYEPYGAGWSEGFTHCRFTLATVNAGGTWESIGLGQGM